MTAIAYEPAFEPTEVRETYLNASHTIRSWLLTRDHKRIAILYTASITFMFVIAACGAALVRINLLTPKGILDEPAMYNKAFSVHGILMVWWFLVPSIPTTLGNFLIPMMIGARDLAFPRINLASWYLFVISSVMILCVVLFGGIDTGWTFYTPYSSMFANTHVTLAVTAIFINGFSSIFTGLNFIVTIHKMRAPGMTWFRLPLFCWSLYATSVIFVLATPILAITLVLLGVERVLRIGIFDPALGGDPILFQHLFWFYSHPVVYIQILPTFGVASEVITCFARKRPFGYLAIAFSSVAIAIIGFLVWAHHMFDAGISPYSGLVFSILSFAVAVPTAIKIFSWTATLYKGSIALDTPILYIFGFMGLFTMGGLTGVMLATLGLDMHMHDTYFVVAHFHYVMVGGAVMGYLAGVHFWWPKATGKMYPEFWGKISAAIIFIGFNLTFFPQYVAGYLGMPRRYHSYPPEFQVYNVLSTAGASILGVGYILPLIYLIWSLKYGKDSGPNPWRAMGLEWQTESPPPTENFEEMPVVSQPPYAYDLQRPVGRAGHLKWNLKSKIWNLQPEVENPMSEHLVTESPRSLVQHQFEDRHQQKEASTLGMWTFLATEVLFFGGLFVCYTIYRHQYPKEFRQGSLDLKWYMGGFNTAVLLLSSFFMALAVHAAAIGSNAKIIRYLVLTIFVGSIFLCVKGMEYYIEYREWLVPGLNFSTTPPTEEQMGGFTRGFDKFDKWFNTRVSPPRDEAATRPQNEQLFMLFYFIMTAIHATHMIIGICVMLVLIRMAKRGMFSTEWHNPVECFGLYWHFVDIVWVFLFPTLYLLRNP